VDDLLAFAHILAAFWYVAGLTAVQLSLVRAWQSDELAVRARRTRTTAAQFTDRIRR